VVGASVTSVNAAPSGAPARGRVIVVDDDGAQCPRADASSVQGALEMANDGDRVRVCAGLYREALTIKDSVTLQGEVGAAASFDCLDPAAGRLDDIDPSRFAIVQPPAVPLFDGALVRVEADDVEVMGLVLQGHLDPVVDTPEVGINLYDAAVSVTDAWSGTRLHHNLLRLNTLGVELGAADSRVDHNCFRENQWALANQRYELKRARIHDNTTFRTEVSTWEVGWRYRATEDVLLDHNVSYEQNCCVAYVDHSTRARVIGNEIHATGQGVRINPHNVGVEVRGNTVTGGGPGLGLAGIVVITPGTRPATTGLVIADNHVSAMGGSVGGRGILLQAGAQPTGAVITGNTLRDNALEGIAISSGNHLSTLTGNTATGHRVSGIRLAGGATRNTLVDNVALANNTDLTGVDARDGGLAAEGVTPTSNQWVRTTCVKDDPPGAICVPPATVSP